MQNDQIEKIYDEVLDFCNKKGLIKKLQQSLDVSEVDRFSMLSIDKDGLDILDAVHCLFDKKRTIMFLEEIDKVLNPGDIVVEAGIGTGILSFMASPKASKVYGFEINKPVYDLAMEIKNHLLLNNFIKDNVFFVLGDARKFNSKIKADIIISENLYTGMFFEKQVEIVKSLRYILKNSGKFVPSGMKSSLFLCNSNLEVKDKMHVVSEMKFIPSYLSDEFLYDNMDFKNINNSGVQFESIIPIIKDGYVNSILICSEVLLPTGKIIGRFDTVFMNNDIIIPTNQVFLKKGDRVNLKISYLYGSDPKDCNISLFKV